MIKAKRKNEDIEFINFILNKDKGGFFDIIKLVKIMTDSELLHKMSKQITLMAKDISILKIDMKNGFKLVNNRIDNLVVKNNLVE